MPSTVRFNNVLLVEDNPGDARLVTEYLRERFGEDCKVQTAQTLAAGLAVLDEQEIDVVLLDLGLPDSSGLEAFLTIRAKAPNTPVVILTGDNDEDKALAALRIGAEDYLAKQQADSVTLIRAMRHAVQRSRLGEQVRASESRYKSLVNTAEEGILQLTREGEVKYANRRAAHLLGFKLSTDDRDLASGRRFHTWVSPQDQVSADFLLRTPAGERVSCELQMLREDEGPCFVLAAAGGLESNDGQATDLVVLLTDITGRRLAEDELGVLKAELELQVDQRTAELQGANAELQSTNHALAHDLRNPLNGIIGLTALVRREYGAVLPPSADQRLQLVHKTALDMNEMISSLLSLASLGRQELKKEDLDLTAMVNAVAQRLHATDERRHVIFKVQAGVRALGDRALVSNVLQNLLHNAWKYSSTTPDSVIEFKSEVDGVNDEVYTVYAVSDNGVGFDEKQAAALFEPFTRLPSAQAFEGNGLGLAGVRRIVERHGGRIWARSVPNGLTTFSFTLAPAQHRGSPISPRRDPSIDWALSAAGA